MKNITELSLFILNSIGVYCVLTFPHMLNFLNYPIWLFIIIGIISGISGSLISKWEINRINKQNGTKK